jgi:hypothetical protein
LTSEPSSPVSSRAIATSLVVALVALGVFNFIVRYLAYDMPARVAIRAIDSTRGATYLAFGNSLIEAGFDSAAFAANMNPEPAVALNAGLGGTSSVQHLLLLREALRRDPTIRVVIYGFYDFQLSETGILKNADLIGNYAISYYLDPEIALRYYQMSPRDRLEFEVMRRLPMMVERGKLWQKVELLRRALGGIGMPHEQNNRFGRAADFNLLEATREDFVSACARWSAPTAGLSGPILEIIRESQAHGAKLVFVEMPMPPFHQRTYYNLPQWSRYRSKLRELVTQTGSEFVSASDWISDPPEFVDHLHLGQAGAQDFTRRLALYIRSQSGKGSM